MSGISNSAACLLLGFAACLGNRLVRLDHWVFVARWAMRNARRLIQAEVHRRRRRDNAFAPASATFPHNLAFVRAWLRRRLAHRGWAGQARQPLA